MEKWLPIPFAPKYQASSEGRILGVYGKIMTPCLTERGYLVLDLHKRQYRVNRIICWTFHGEPPSDLHHAAHRDNNSVNNREENLYWATPWENGQDLKASDHIKGQANCRNVLVEKDVELIRRLRDEGWTVAEIHRQYFPMLCSPTIYHAANGRTWSHVA